MARLTPSDVQPGSPLLTGFSVAYTNNSGFIAKDAIGVFPVTQDKGAFKKWDARSFLSREDTLRAPGGKYYRSNPALTEVTYSTQERGHEAPLDRDTKDNAISQLAIDRTMSEFATAKVLLQLEKDAAALLQTSGSYASTVTLSGTGQWSNLTQSNPIGVVQTGKEVIRAKTGRYPDTMTMSASVLSSLVQNAQILARLQGVQRQGTADITLELLGTIFGIKRILVGGPIEITSVEGQADTYADLWNDSVALTISDEPFEMGRNFGVIWSRWGKNLVITDPAYPDDPTRSDIYRSRAKYDFDVISSVSGYLIIDALA
jgi:hypothetical protein